MVGSSWPRMLNAATSHADSDTRRTMKVVADHRGHEADHQPGQRQLGGDRQQIAAARPGRMPHRDARHDHQHREHRGRGVADQHAHEHPQRRRPAHRERGQVDPRADRGAGGECDPGAGQDQAELQIEPGRGDLRADRARGGMQEIDDVSSVSIVKVSSQGRSAHPDKLIRISGRFSTTTALMPSRYGRRGDDQAARIGHIAAGGQKWVGVELWRR